MLRKGIPCGTVVDYDIVASKFEIQSRYNADFWINTFQKGQDPFVPPDMS